LRFGVKLYDWLCAGRNLGPSNVMRRDEVLRRLPNPKADGLTGAVRYYDGLTNDSRLVLDTLRSAAAHGATVLNYARAEEAERHGPGWRCRVQELVDQRSCQISAKYIVHATGPWAQVLPQSSVRLRLTKGVHLVIERDRLRVPDAVVMTEGKRILFAIPWGERVILGTTDTDYSGPLDQITTDSDDVDYILHVVNDRFPDARLHRGDIVGHWAGLRPLIARSRGGPSDISRSHKIYEPQPGWIDVSGGKLTTYRHIAQDVVDRVFHGLDRPSPPCRTADLPLLDAAIDDNSSGILPPEVREEVVAHYCANEWAVHLDDVMNRRTSWQHYHRNDQEVAEQVADWMGKIFGWDYARHSDELARYRGLP
jgi:glycerol-3-phosphate dehydrogenase